MRNSNASAALHLGSSSRATQTANLGREPQGIFCVRGQKGELFVFHAARLALHAGAFSKVEINLSIPTSKVANPSPALVVKAVAPLPASAAYCFFERRSSAQPYERGRLEIVAVNLCPHAKAGNLVGVAQGWDGGSARRVFHMAEKRDTFFSPVENSKNIQKYSAIRIINSPISPTFLFSTKSQKKDGRALRLKLRDLQMVQALAEAGSMAAAAEQLALSQPAISKAMSELEHGLGAAASGP